MTKFNSSITIPRIVIASLRQISHDAIGDLIRAYVACGQGAARSFVTMSGRLVTAPCPNTADTHADR